LPNTRDKSSFGFRQVVDGMHKHPLSDPKIECAAYLYKATVKIRKLGLLSRFSFDLRNFLPNSNGVPKPNQDPS
jgi:hypothetical protein